MSQTHIELTNHLGFQLSLLRLSTIPGPNGVSDNNAGQQAEELEALANCVQTPANR